MRYARVVPNFGVVTVTRSGSGEERRFVLLHDLTLKELEECSGAYHRGEIDASDMLPHDSARFADVLVSMINLRSDERNELASTRRTYDIEARRIAGPDCANGEAPTHKPGAGLLLKEENYECVRLKLKQPGQVYSGCERLGWPIVSVR